MKSKKVKKGGQVTASSKTEAGAGAAASFENNGSGAAPAIEAEGDQNMNETSLRPRVAAASERAEIPLDSIEFDEQSYPRDCVNAKAVKAYAAAMGEGAQFPDVDVFRVGESNVLADGRHRVEAARSLGLKTIWARVYRGTRHEAALHAVMSCAAHGVRRTNADKRKAVMILLQDQEWREWNDSKIARACNVSADLVKSVRQEYGQDHHPETDDGKSRLVERGGKVFTQKAKEGANPLPAHIAAIGEMRELARSACASVIGGDPGLAGRLREMDDELHEILGRATGATRMTEGLREPLNVYEHGLKGGIKATPEFERKKLATHAFNVGLGCGHQCNYCSSPSLRCRAPAYGELQLNAQGRGYAVIDPKSSDRIIGDNPRLTASDTVMLCTCDDAWAPEARRHGVGRTCLEALLKNTPAQIRILTKSAEVAKDLGVAEDDKDRVMVGLSTGIPESREEVAAAVEPNASQIRERLKALKQAHDRGFRTYGMLCPCLPLVADTEAALTEMFKAVRVIGAEVIWLEPVNMRGKALMNTATALRLAGLKAEADAVDAIRNTVVWSKYAADLAETAVKVAEALGVKEKLRVLMYTSYLTPADLGRVKALGGAVILLGKGDDEAGGGVAEAAEDGTADEGGANAADGRTAAA